MSTIQEVLKILEEQKSFISGEEMAKRLKVSRNMIWKSVKALKQEGYIIDSSSSKGYLLSKENNIISKEGIQRHLKNKIFNIEVFKSINSTCIYLKDNALNLEEYTVVISEEQTAGKGRQGNSFFSPKSQGIYMSVLLKPKRKISDCIFLTCLSAVSVVEAIEEEYQIETKIKWVNDVYLKDKKICGILTEASFDMESLNTDFVTIGIGINTKMPPEGYPEEIKNMIDSIGSESKKIDRNLLIARILDKIKVYYEEFDSYKIISLYKVKSLMINKNISFILKEKEMEGKVLDIDANGNLIVETKEGQRILSSGEVKIHKESLFNEN